MLITNAKIYTMVSSIIENGFILIKDSKRADLGDMENLNYEDDFVLDLKGESIYPGFIDAHTHLGMFENGLAFEGDDGNEENDPIAPNLRAIDAINPMDKCFEEALMAGVTTVVTGPGSANAIGGEMACIKTCGKRIDNMIIKAPIAIKFALGENPKTVYNGKNQSPSTRMATASLIREQLYKALEYLRNLELFQSDEENYDKPAYDAKCEALIPLLKREIQAHFHAHRADDIFTAIRIAKEFNLDYVIVHATEAHLVADEIKDENARLLVGPILCDRSKPELVNLDTKSASILKKHNIDFSIVTDHPVIPIQYLSLSAALASREGLDKYEALKAITINAANILGINDRVGSIEVGKDADLVVFSSSALNIEETPDIVIINGKIQKQI